jgi:ferritin-like protein
MLDPRKVDAIVSRQSLYLSFGNNDNLAEEAELTNVYYFAGRCFLIQGEKDRGIQYLKRAAAFNSHKSTRTLAAVQLRAMGIEPPKPGALP